MKSFFQVWRRFGCKQLIPISLTLRFQRLRPAFVWWCVKAIFFWPRTSFFVVEMHRISSRLEKYQLQHCICGNRTTSQCCVRPEGQLQLLIPAGIGTIRSRSLAHCPLEWHLHKGPDLWLEHIYDSCVFKVTFILIHLMQYQETQVFAISNIIWTTKEIHKRICIKSHTWLRGHSPPCKALWDDCPAANGSLKDRADLDATAGLLEFQVATVREP